MKLLVTGGCGFIGSNFVRFVLEAAADVEITVLDLLTYAGSLQNLGDLLEAPTPDFRAGRHRRSGDRRPGRGAERGPS